MMQHNVSSRHSGRCFEWWFLQCRLHSSHRITALKACHKLYTHVTS